MSKENIYMLSNKIIWLDTEQLAGGFPLLIYIIEPSRNNTVNLYRSCHLQKNFESKLDASGSTIGSFDFERNRIFWIKLRKLLLIPHQTTHW
jgi:cupin superfamily acireductone dioxygenase involved in methionine salvage